MKLFVLGFLMLLLVSCGGSIVSDDIITDVTEDMKPIEEQKLDEVAVEDIVEVVDDVVVDEYADWSGEYYSEDNKMLELLGPSETGWVDADFAYDDIECAGLWLLANLERSGVANFYSETTACIMNFTYNPGIVIVNSHKCEDYEDAKCGSLSGTYKIK